MSDVVTCRVCGSTVSSEAPTCPKCGDPNPAGNRKRCSRCGRYVDSLSDYRGSSIGIGTIRNICDDCWEAVADIDENMVGH
jgi:predicted amidophosphoribosyltransferase